MLNITNEIERVQLVRALTQRKDLLDTVDQLSWNKAGDKGGTFDEARSAVSRMLQQAKKIKFSKD